MGKFRQFLTELSARDTPIFSFPVDNFSKYQGILTKLEICIDIKEMWFGIANKQISLHFGGVIYPRHAHIFVSGLDLSIYQGILTKLGTCIDIKGIWFGISNGQISSIFDRVICPQHDNGGATR